MRGSDTFRVNTGCISAGISCEHIRDLGSESSSSIKFPILIDLIQDAAQNPATRVPDPLFGSEYNFFLSLISFDDQNGAVG